MYTCILKFLKMLFIYDFKYLTNDNYLTKDTY